jgi:hypothetical protein
MLSTSVSKKLAVLTLVLLLSSFLALPAFAAESGAFFKRANDHYQRTCKNRGPWGPAAIECFVFPKVTELDQIINSLVARISALENNSDLTDARFVKVNEDLSTLGKQLDAQQTIIASQSAQISYLKEKIATLSSKKTNF